MARRQRDELIAPADEERIGADERARRLAVRTSVAKAASISRSVLASRTMHLPPDGARRRLHVLGHAPRQLRLFGLTSTAIAVGARHQLAQQLQPLRPKLARSERLTPVTLPPGRLRLATRPILTGSRADGEHDRNRRGRRFGRERRQAPPVVTITATWRRDQIGRQRRQPIESAVRPAIFDRHVLALDIAGFAQALAKRRTAARICRSAIGC